MPEQLENKMVVDWAWNEIEFGVPDGNIVLSVGI